jgi:hypothetical protein
MARVDIDYLKSRFQTGDRPDGQDYQDLIDTLIAQALDLGTVGNNTDHEITGIENVTVIDTFLANEWRFVKYLVSISKITNGENKFYATELSVLVDGTNTNVAEYGVIDNNGDMGTISVSRNGNAIGLVVTPNPAITPITVRFARVGLKA